MPLVATRGAASAQGFGEFAQATAVNYIEDVFSCFLYTGNGSTQTITNGIDLSTKGGLVWIKRRNGVYSHVLYDTSRGVNLSLSSNTTGANVNQAPDGVSAFNATGFSLNGNSHLDNNTTGTYASWTFRKQPKFFDVVTYTGNGTAGRTVSHNLGSAPAFMVIKRTDSADEWFCYHRSLGAGKGILLNSTSASFNAPNYFNSTEPTSTVFTLGTDSGLNGNGFSYVAYLFAHNAGGFGLTGSDNVISCGSFTTDPSTGGATVNLGYEPQWLLVKSATSVQGWHLIDNMRGMANRGTYGDAAFLEPNTSSAEDFGANCYPTANGFWYARSGNTTYIYIAIRRGPMKVPTSGTSVFSPIARTGTGTSTAVTTPNFPPDMLLQARRGAPDWPMSDRLRGVGQNLAPCYTSAESTPSPAYVESYDMTGATLGSGNAVNGSGLTYIEYFFRRAPSFFDEVCYTGTGSARTIAHNLGVAPELLIFKKRSATSNWTVVMPAIGGNAVSLNLNDYGGNSNIAFVSSFGTSSITTASGYDTISESGSTYVAYLFATCAGVSKVGNYTGTGAALTVNCGFTSGARFVMIKRLDGTNIYRGWYVWDSARGITSGNDPYLLLNETSAETTGTNYVDSASSGFTLTTDSAGASGGALNASGGTYIFLAIA